VASIVENVSVGRLLLEGGATAAAILYQLRWTRLTVATCLARGLAGLRPVVSAGPLVVIKPGTYDWPDDIFS
jgi:uncharacterized protein YgbK (DUF1537 family)